MPLGEASRALQPRGVFFTEPLQLISPVALKRGSLTVASCSVCAFTPDAEGHRSSLRVGVSPSCLVERPQSPQNAPRVTLPFSLLQAAAAAAAAAATALASTPAAVVVAAAAAGSAPAPSPYPAPAPVMAPAGGP